MSEQSDALRKKPTQLLSVAEHRAVTRVLTGCKRLSEELNVSQQPHSLTGPSHQRMWLLPVDKSSILRQSQIDEFRGHGEKRAGKAVLYES